MSENFKDVKNNYFPINNKFKKSLYYTGGKQNLVDIRWTFWNVPKDLKMWNYLYVHESKICLVSYGLYSRRVYVCMCVCMYVCVSVCKVSGCDCVSFHYNILVWLLLLLGIFYQEKESTAILLSLALYAVFVVYWTTAWYQKYTKIVY